MENNTELDFDLSEYINEKKITINISVEKITLFPGEELKGFIYIKGKPILTNPLFLYALVNTTITQIYYYEYDLESKLETDEGQEKLKIKIVLLIKYQNKKKKYYTPPYLTTVNIQVII